MDEDFLDLIDLAFFEGQFDGETVDSIYLLLADGSFYNPFRETPALPLTWERSSRNDGALLDITFRQV